MIIQRVAQISCNYNGAQKQIENAIYDYLLERGIICKVFFNTGSSSNPDFIKYENTFTEFIRRAYYKIFKDYKGAHFQTKRLIKYLDDFHPDIVHLHTIHHGFIDYPLLFNYLKKHKIPVVYTAHDMWPFTGGCYHFTVANCGHFMDGCDKCILDQKLLDCKKTKTKHSLEKKLACYSGQNIVFVSVSNWVNEELEQSLIAGYRHTVVHNSISIDVSREDDSFINNVKKWIGDRTSLLFIASSWTQTKGIQLIRQLASIIDQSLCIVVVGNVSDHVVNSMPGNVFFAGYISQPANLRALYRFCNFHVSASREETFGMTFVEAAFQGTRSIGFADTAVKETLHCVKGFSSETFNAEGLYKTILNHINESRLSDSDIASIKKEFMPDVMASKYYNVYLDLINNTIDNL